MASERANKVIHRVTQDIVGWLGTTAFIARTASGFAKTDLSKRAFQSPHDVEPEIYQGSVLLDAGSDERAGPKTLSKGREGRPRRTSAGRSRERWSWSARERGHEKLIPAGAVRILRSSQRRQDTTNVVPAAVTGWLPLTMRAAPSGLRKGGRSVARRCPAPGFSEMPAICRERVASRGCRRSRSRRWCSGHGASNWPGTCSRMVRDALSSALPCTSPLAVSRWTSAGSMRAMDAAMMDGGGDHDGERRHLSVALTLAAHRRRREIILPDNAPASLRPIRQGEQQNFVRAIAPREDDSKRMVRMLLLAFPDLRLMRAALHRSLPCAVSARRFIDAAIGCHAQWRAIDPSRPD